MKKTNIHNRVLPLLAVAFAVQLPTISLAQPHEAVPEPAARKFPGMDLTPEQRREVQAQQSRSRIRGIRRDLTAAGFTSEAIQDAVVSYYEDGQEAGLSLNEAYRNLLKVTADKALSDEELAKQLSDFCVLVQNEKVRREDALQNLRIDLDLAHKPRLDCLLMTMGVVGDEREIATQSDPLGSLMNIIANMGEMADAKVTVDGK